MATKPKIGQIRQTRPRFEEVQFDPSQLESVNFYDGAPVLDDKAPPQERSTPRAVADVALSLGQGATGAFKALFDLGGADNTVSRGLGSMTKFLGDQKSEQSQAILKNSMERIKASEESGSTWEEAKAYLGMVWDQPAEMIAQGAGSFATLGIGKLAQAAKLASAAKASGVSKDVFLASNAGKAAIKAASDVGFRANVALGAGMGVGAVKGSQFEQTYNSAIEKGMPPEEAKALAMQAQEYGGAGTMQQVLGGGLGLLASATGPIERMVVGRGGAANAGGILVRTGKGFLVEGPTEGAQGAQERFAGNDAAVDAGVLAPENRMRGVVGQGLQEGALGGILGGGIGALQGRGPADPTLAPGTLPPPVPPPVSPPPGPMTRALGAGAPLVPPPLPINGIPDPLLPSGQGAGLEGQPGAPLGTGSQAQPMATGPADLDDPVRDQIRAMPDGDRQDALRAYAVVGRTDVSKGVQQYNRKLLDRLLARNAPAPLALDAGAAPESQALANDQLTAVERQQFARADAQRSPAQDPLGELQGQVRSATNYTGTADVQEKYTQLEDAWLAMNADEQTEPATPLENADAPRTLPESEMGTAFVDSKVRGSKIRQGLQNALDGGPSSAVQIVNVLNQSLIRIGESPLSETEQKSVLRVADAHFGFLGASEAAPLPGDPDQAQDPAADNSSMEALIPERKARAIDSMSDEDLRGYLRNAQDKSIRKTVGDELARRKRDATPPPLAEQPAAPEMDPIQPTDILNPSGAPFKTRMAAQRKTAQTPGDVLPVAGGFVIRPAQERPLALDATNVQNPAQDPAQPGATAQAAPAQAPEAGAVAPTGQAAAGEQAGAGAVQADGVAALADSKEARQSRIDAEMMESRKLTQVAQPTPMKRISFDSMTLSGPKKVNAKLYELPGYEGPQLAVAEYKTSRGTGYKVYLPKTGMFIQDSNGVSTLEDTLKLAVIRVRNAREAIVKRGVSANTPPTAVTPQDTRTPGPVLTPAQPQGATNEVTNEIPSTDEIAQQEASAEAKPVLSGEPEQEASATQQKALDRIAKGTAYFGDSQKAREFIAKADLRKTHEVKQTKPGRFEVVAKAGVEPALPVDVQQTIAGAVSVDGLSDAEVEQVAAMFADKPVKPAAAPSANTIFTEDAAAAARARLKAKLGRLNSGIDPEMMMDGITLAGYHIEKGARSFAAYARAMVGDLGDGVKPYLKSWYMGIKYDPRAAGFDGMDSAATVEAADIERVTAAEKSPEKPVPKAQALPAGWTEASPGGLATNTDPKTGGIVDSQIKSGKWFVIPNADALKSARNFDTRAEAINHLEVLAAEQNAEKPSKDGGKEPWEMSWSEFESQRKGNPAFDKKGITDSEYLTESLASYDKIIADRAASQAKPAPAPTDLTSSLYQAITDGNMPKDNPALKKLVEAFDGKPADPARMKQGQEALEAAIVRVGRDVVAKKEGRRNTFDALLTLYQSQPNLNIRTSTSVANQAYSTPVPLAYLGSLLSGVNSRSSLYEPTAGNGMLTIGAKPSNVQVNELNSERQASLLAQGFKATTQNDASTFTPEGEFDVVHMNPPFGSVKDASGKPVKVKVDGFSIGQIDHLIAVNALKAMKADGSAMLIIGANKVAGQLSLDDRIFFNWLYGNYNVTGHFEVDGDLYTRQGAGWPVRVITIKGRQKSARFAPVAGTIQRAQNWEQVYEYTTNLLDTRRQPDATGGNDAVSASVSQAPSRGVPGFAVTQTPGGGRSGARGGARGNGNVAGTRTGSVPDLTGPAVDRLGDGDREQRLGFEPVERDQLEPAGQPEKPADAKPARTAGADALTTEGNQFQAPYTARSARKDSGVLIPANMAQPTQDALSRLEDEVGDIDEFARKELGYKSVSDMHEALMGLQVDSVAMAIHQIKRDKAVVIADQTGIGKGRQAAAIIRWAARNGFTPVFMSVKPSLFTDMYGDLADIGTNDINPFIMNGDAWIAGADGGKLFANKAVLHRARMERIASTGALPADSNAVFMTYSQINVENTQRRALLALAPNAVFVLDEAHNAAGASATGDFVIGALGLAKGVTYLSATYAKRPDNMPLYFKTDIGSAAADNDALTDAMTAGGLPLQTVVSNNLVKAGQMFRRERSYDGVNIESKSDAPNRKLHEKMSNEATKALRAIVSADKMFHSIYVKTLDKRLAKEGAAVKDNAGNQASAGVQHTEFSSVVHNFVKQMLLGLKAQTAANEAIASLKRGEKPIIAVENTMGSFLAEYTEDSGISQGEALRNFDYRTVLTRALERSRVVTIKLPNGDEVKQPVKLSDLDPLTQKTYSEAQKVIDGLVLDIPVSPIDWMRAEIIRAGYTVAEITGRNLAVDYTDPKNPMLGAIDMAEQKDKVSTTRRFNSGQLDALVLNVAGSTGISLHASERFEDQRQRHMIVGQAAGDINVFMQMLGRIHRTGQVKLPKYTILSVDLPTEKRPTAVLSNKMKSLNANTSSNTESATSVKSADILNKYGDQIVNQYLLDNFELARQLGVDDLVQADGQGITDDLARKATGRLALQPIEVQDAFYEDVESQYNALIDYLNKTNQNELEPRTFDFDAKELRQEVLFEGPDPTTPFGENAIYGEYSIKAQGVAMKPAEINDAITESLDGNTVGQHAAKMANALDAQYNAFVEKLTKAAAVEGQSAEAASSKQAETAATVRSAGLSFLESHPIGGKYRVDINSDTFNAIITNVRNTHKANGNPFSLSKFQVTISVNGALRSLTVPATQFRKIEVSGLSSQYTVEQLFKEQPPGQRETAKIVTGNLLAGYGELQGSRGTIITFTKEDGTQEQGILLPKLFDYTKNTRGDFRLPTAADALKFLQTSDNKDIGRFGIMSRDSVVRVLPNARGVRIQVPKSKVKGGKYFLDKPLIEVAGDFTSSGAFMVAQVFEPKAAVKALDILMKKQALYALPSMADEAKALVGDKPAAFSRATPKTNTIGQPAVTQIVDAIRARWANAPEIVVVANMDDPAIPKAVRDADTAQRSQGATGEPEGFFYDGKVYVVASAMQSPSAVVRVLFHESLGHAGLRGVFGDALAPILDQIASLRRAEIIAKAREYGLVRRGADGKPVVDVKTATDSEVLAAMDRSHKREAAEEVLAVMAQTKPELGFVKRAIAAIRAFLRKNVPSFADMKLTDADIIQQYILPARAFVERGGVAGGRASAPAMSRGAADQTRSEAFKRWYSGNDGQANQKDDVGRASREPADSAFRPQRNGPLDDQNRPVVFYHGTRDDITAFDANHANRKDKGWLGRGIYGISDPDLASAYASMKRGSGSQNVMPLYFAVTNPYKANLAVKRKLRNASQEAIDAFTEEVKANGHDGVMLELEDGVIEIVAFKPTQVKSATGNNGDFDPANPDIRFSRTSPAGIQQALMDAIPRAVTDRLADIGTSQRGFNRWWHRTVGTQFHKAKINAEYGRVYYAVQDFMKDVSRMATLAAEQAPDLLPQVDTFADIKKVAPDLLSSKQRKADLKASSDALFDGTLRYTRDEDGNAVEVQAGDPEPGGLVWTDAELAARGMNQKSIKMYRQARAAINQSLDNLMASDVYRMMTSLKPEMYADTKAQSKQMLVDVRKAAATDNPDSAVAILKDGIAKQEQRVKQDLKTQREALKDAEGNEVVLLQSSIKRTAETLSSIIKARKQIEEKQERIASLKAAGYAPLSRFGEYTLDVTDGAERVFFGMYESQYEANRAARKFSEEGLTVRQGIKSQKEFQLLKGISPETAMLFAELLGVEQNTAMQAWLQNAVAEQSALKRHIRRKGIKGFDNDASRVVASFLTSNSRAASRALHGLRIQESVESIQGPGDVKDEAIALTEYVQNPIEEAQAIRSLLFINYIGGSISSALVNLTQTVVQTFPYLAQYGGARKSAARVGQAMKMAVGEIADPALAVAVKRAELEGVIKPQEVYQLQAEASRTLGSNLRWRAGIALWGNFFQLAEQYNRRVAFIAGYQTALAQNIANPYAFAEATVEGTQGTFNKGNRPDWARGAIGATLFTFKSFTVQYVEFLKRLPPKERALALAVLVMLAGAGGLPFAEDAEDVIDTVAQALGYNFTSKAARDRFLVEHLGRDFASFLQYGASGTGMLPFDVSSRLGMANLLPGTGLLKAGENKQNQVLEVFGVAGSFVRDALKGEMRPIALRNATKGWDMYNTGIYTDTRGRKMMQASPVDAAFKAIGLQPAGVATESRAVRMQYDLQAPFTEAKREITEQIALGMFENDQTKIQRARAKLNDWNEKNPEAKIMLNSQSIRRRVAEMRKDRKERFLKSTPKELRASTREAIQ